jgi:hypothetical protein
MDVKSALRSDVRLPEGVVARVSERAASDAVRPPWWRVLVPMVPRPALVSAVPVALLVLAVGLPIVMRPSSPLERESESPAALNLQVADGLVHVSWLDGRVRPYRVYKSTNPRDLGKGEAQLVRGNEWVDKQADSAPIVFYRID